MSLTSLLVMVFLLDLTAQGKAIEAKYKQLGLHQVKKFCTQKKRSYQQKEKSTYSTKDDKSLQIILMES